MQLAEAIHAKVPVRIAVIGGGGKTTAVFQLARQLDGPVWVTTTTHLGTDQLQLADRHVIVPSTEEARVEDWLKQKVTLLTGDYTPDDRIKGPGEVVLQKIYATALQQNVSLIVEADGSRSRPIKAPGPNEPVIPEWAEIVITVAGLSAVGQIFSGETVHRVEPFANLTGLQPGEEITIQSIARLLCNPLGGLKGHPRGAMKVAMLNQADTENLLDLGKSICRNLLQAGYDCVVIGSLKYHADELICFKVD